MKRRRWWALVIVCILLAAFASWTIQRYRSRPFFASSFYVVGPGGFLLNWDLTRGVPADDGLHIRYDRRERVLLVVRVEANHNIQWLVDGQPVSDRLRIRRQSDDACREIDWRRDSIIFVDSDGTPTYTPLAHNAIERAMADPRTMTTELSSLVKGLRTR